MTFPSPRRFAAVTLPPYDRPTTTPVLRGGATRRAPGPWVPAQPPVPPRRSRRGLAVPAEDSPEGVVPGVALAVTDEQRMTEALDRARQGADFGFAVRDGYVLITDSQE
jgi:hypothetical protein